MIRRRKLSPRTRRIALFVLLLTFLAGGVTLRIINGPYAGGPRMLGVFSGRAELPEVGVRFEPECVDSGRPKPGQPLSGLLTERGVSPSDADEFLPRLSKLIDLHRTTPRDEIRLHSDRSGLLRRLEYHPRGSAAGTIFVVARDSSGFRAYSEREPLTPVVRKYAGSVRGSLFASMTKAGVPSGQVDGFCDIFSCDVDFLTATRDGDGWEMLMEEFVDAEGARVRSGRILGGRYVNAGTPFEAFHFAPEGTAGGYYRGDGESLRRAFLKAPLNYRRISSGYTHRRLHPIFNVVRPHLGVDYAAPYGTPVVAVADGVVLSAGWMRGYGRLLRLRHREGIVTYSAHLARFAAGMRPGATVRQGDVVGFVGMSGNATGPHLDFRIERNGQFIDPLRFRSGGGDPLAQAHRPGFLRQVDACREVLASLGDGAWIAADHFAARVGAASGGFAQTAELHGVPAGSPAAVPGGLPGGVSAGAVAPVVPSTGPLGH